MLSWEWKFLEIQSRDQDGNRKYVSINPNSIHDQFNQIICENKLGLSESFSALFNNKELYSVFTGETYQTVRIVITRTMTKNNIDW